MMKKLAAPPDIKATLPAMRLLLLVASGLVFTVGISLNLLTTSTERFFAWTIQPPLTAAFLGGGYWAAFLLEYLSSRQRVWAKARLAVPAVLIFTTLTLILTLLHLERFHFSHPETLVRLGAWIWLAVYAVVPPVMAVIWILQGRAPGGDPPRENPLPPALRWIISLQGSGMLLLGAGLFLAPLPFAALWPWTLTALTGRAVGAWLVGLGVADLHAAWENDFTRLGAFTVSHILYAALQLIALLRFPEAVDWTKPAAWVYLLFQASLLAVGLYAAWRAKKGTRA